MIENLSSSLSLFLAGLTAFSLFIRDIMGTKYAVASYIPWLHSQRTFIRYFSSFAFLHIEIIRKEREAENLFTSYANTFWCLQVCKHNKDNSTSFIKNIYTLRAWIYKDVYRVKTKWNSWAKEEKEALSVQSLRGFLSLPFFFSPHDAVGGERRGK